jgi:glucokinase
MGDKLCIDIVENIGVLNAMGVASAINVYDPDLVTLGGAVTLNNVEQVLNPIKKHFKEYIVNREAEIAVTPLGDDIGLYGALALAFRLHKDKA